MVIIIIEVCSGPAAITRMKHLRISLQLPRRRLGRRFATADAQLHAASLPCLIHATPRGFQAFAATCRPITCLPALASILMLRHS